MGGPGRAWGGNTGGGLGGAGLEAEAPEQLEGGDAGGGGVVRGRRSCVGGKGYRMGDSDG